MLDARTLDETTCIRITVQQVKGSAPRDEGTYMDVTQDGETGTIGGGRLELEAIRHARSLLTSRTEHDTRRFALGPSLGQCCGGAVTLGFHRQSAVAQPTSCIIRPLPKAVLPFPRPVVIYGAGHVSRALAPALQTAARANVTVFDPRPDQVEHMPKTIPCITSRAWSQIVSCTPQDACHFIMTPDHEVDLTLCHQLLSRKAFAFVGLIGSATKWARFQSRLTALGHAKAEIARITCPIGDPSLGKDPESIAAGVVAALLTDQALLDAHRDTNT